MYKAIFYPLFNMAGYHMTQMMIPWTSKRIQLQPNMKTKTKSGK